MDGFLKCNGSKGALQSSGAGAQQRRRYRLKRRIVLEDHPWCEPDDHPFSKASILTSVLSSIHHFLQIILVLNLLCGMEFNKLLFPNSSDDLCLLVYFFFYGLKDSNPESLWKKNKSQLRSTFLRTLNSREKS